VVKGYDMKLLDKTLDTVNTVALAFVALPGAIRELQAYTNEANHDGQIATERQLTKRITELEIENRKLQEANLGLALERDEANELNQLATNQFTEKVRELEQNLVDSGALVLALETECAQAKRIIGITEIQLKLANSIAPPDPGEGFELCGEEDAKRGGSVEYQCYNPEE
jgi:hypothetical protein